MVVELKRKLRALKKFEEQLRGPVFLMNNTHRPLVWNVFFSTKDESDESVKYNLKTLKKMNHEALKEVMESYFYHVYYAHYKDLLLPMGGCLDPELATFFNLNYDSELDEIKKAFRELAKKYHPDMGGDHTQFLEILNQYKKLTEG